MFRLVSLLLLLVISVQYSESSSSFLLSYDTRFRDSLEPALFFIHTLAVDKNIGEISFITNFTIDDPYCNNPKTWYGPPIGVYIKPFIYIFLNCKLFSTKRMIILDSDTLQTLYNEYIKFDDYIYILNVFQVGNQIWMNLRYHKEGLKLHYTYIDPYPYLKVYNITQVNVNINEISPSSAVFNDQPLFVLNNNGLQLCNLLGTCHGSNIHLNRRDISRPLPTLQIDDCLYICGDNSCYCTKSIYNIHLIKQEIKASYIKYLNGYTLNEEVIVLFSHLNSVGLFYKSNLTSPIWDHYFINPYFDIQPFLGFKY